MVPSAMRTVEFYLGFLGRETESSFLQRIACPVLVEAGAGERSDERALQTAIRLRSDKRQDAVDASRRAVLLVQRKLHGVFAEHISVGRTPNLDVCIPRVGISKFHACFSVAALHEYHLTDKHSKNGTSVDDRRLVPGVPVPLLESSEIRFGSSVFRFMLPSGFYKYICEAAVHLRR